MNAVHELEYTRNSLAISMIKGRTNIILIMVPDFINGFFSSIIQGVENYIRHEGYVAMVCAIGDEQRIDLAAMVEKYTGMFDGVILIPTEPNFDWIHAIDKPVVIVDRYIPGSGLTSVTVDNMGGTYRLTKLLLGKNHRDIAIICDDSPMNIGHGRFNGYMQAMHEYGIEPPREYVHCGGIFEDFGYKSTVQLIHCAKSPTAIVACGNLLCTGAILAFHDMGIKIGEDISLVGFDENILASKIKPGVTVVTGYPVELGRCAAEKLIQRLKEPGLPHEEIVMDMQLIERGSVVRLEG